MSRRYRARRGFTYESADLDCPRLIANVHQMVNEHRRDIGLPEWDFNKRPEEQWWKKIPAIAELVAAKIKSLSGVQAMWKMSREWRKGRKYGKRKAALQNAVK